MYLEKITKNLEKFDYNYSTAGDIVTVKLDFSHVVTIELCQNRIIIKDKLLGWNFLTGAIEMSLKSSFIYNFVGAVVFGFLCLFASFELNIELNSLYLLFITWVILFSGFYLANYHSFRQQIMYWTHQ
ncbi:hypothetical protein M0M57_05875 [Flavobacterium azooxidireducens]|uniref:Uncharacterized protein n=1 Tax=Flavobacterium azooxidireducens TaxID=1871076 RepID=A0ABY4KHR4_9FLAO|nr:hypothetical protein [Flavobacterium azooxidireducens]UPQ80364.1 hypothetical protein M0M57_05875 [Flavobacterium azooxidireducens]